MTQSHQPRFSWKVHLLGGSLVGLALAVFVALLIRCHRESVSLSKVFSLWGSLGAIDESLPGADLARVELLSNVAMLAILGAGVYLVALLGKSLSFQALRTHGNPRLTLKRVRLFALSLMLVGLLNLVLGAWMIASVRHLGVDFLLAFREWARGFEVDRTYDSREILASVVMSSAFARLITAISLVAVAVLILRRDRAIRRELDGLAC